MNTEYKRVKPSDLPEDIVEQFKISPDSTVIMCKTEKGIILCLDPVPERMLTDISNEHQYT
ncbi:MAG: hypothetical protein J6S13_09115 [Clostridia bacterium]|nr:hypothetical protein [Clostridia bacterium]